MHIGERLRRAMKRAGLTQRQIAERTHTHVGTISKLMSGETANPNWDTVAGIVEAIGTTWGDLFDEPRIHLSVKDAALVHEFNDFLERLIANDRAQKQRRQTKTAGEIRDAPSDEVVELPNEMIDEEFVRGRANRAYKVLTDSMIGIGIWEGSKIFARATVDLDSADGKIAVVRLNNTLFLKRVDRRGQQTVLTSENPRYADIHVGSRDAIELVAILVP